MKFIMKILVSSAFLLLTANLSADSKDPAPTSLAGQVHEIGLPSNFQVNLSFGGGYLYHDNNPFASFTAEGENSIYLNEYRGITLGYGIEAIRDVNKFSFRPKIGLGPSFLKLWVEWDSALHKFGLAGSVSPFVNRDGTKNLRVIFGNGRVEANVTLYDVFHHGNHRDYAPETVSLPTGKSVPTVDIPISASVLEHLKNLDISAYWIDQLTSPNLMPDGKNEKEAWASFDQRLQKIKDHLSPSGSEPRTLSDDIQLFHSSIQSAYNEVSPTIATQLAYTTRSILRQNLIVPIDRLFGQQVERPDFEYYRATSFEQFVKALEKLGVKSKLEEAKLATIFNYITNSISKTIAAGQIRWDADGKNLKTIWIPLQYCVTTAEIDSQTEMDRLVSQVVGPVFRPAKRIEYLHNSRFIDVMTELVLRAKDHHVLVIHDVKGFNGKQKPDEISWNFAAEGYLQAYINAIKGIDLGTRDGLPDFLVFIDRLYYNQNGSHDLLDFLESVYKFPKVPDAGKVSAKVQSKLNELHALVRSSQGLKRVAAHYKSENGRDYLEDHLRIHANITNSSNGSNPSLPLYMDHRKFAFIDAFENRPDGGIAITTGQGIGEEYLGTGWEDRSLLFYGSPAVDLKTAARELFLTQGGKLEDLPEALKQNPIDKLHMATGDHHIQIAITLTEHDRPKGKEFRKYGRKEGTVLKATLYTLMPKGSVIIAPDSIWTSDIWAGMFVGAALRGVNVYAIAADKQNAASAGTFQFAGTYVTFRMMMDSSQTLKEEIMRAGGSLNAGFYALHEDVEDLRQRIQDLADRPTHPPYFDTQFRFSEATRAKVSHDLAAYIATLGAPNHVIPIDPKAPLLPKLHMKDQFFANSEALHSLQDESWAGIIHDYLEIRKQQTQRHREFPTNISTDLFSSLKAGYSPNALMYLSVGSHNQDRRSMFLNGESTATVSGFDGFLSALDFYFLLKKSTWMSSHDELEEHMPKPSNTWLFIVQKAKDLI